MKTLLKYSAFSLLLSSICFSFVRKINLLPEAYLSGRITDASSYTIAGVKITAHIENASCQLLQLPPQRTVRTLSSFPRPLPDSLRACRILPSRNFAFAHRHGRPNPRRQLEIAQVSENVVVTANTQPLELSQTPAPVDVVTQDEISQRQLVSIADALQTLPGATIARTGREGGLTTFFLDGGNSNFTKFFITARPSTNRADFSIFRIKRSNNIDKIEVVHGAEALSTAPTPSPVWFSSSAIAAPRASRSQSLREGGGFFLRPRQRASRWPSRCVSITRSPAPTSKPMAREATTLSLIAVFPAISVTASATRIICASPCAAIQLRRNSRPDSSPAPQPLPIRRFKLLLIHLSWDFRTGSHWAQRISGHEKSHARHQRNPSANPPFTFIDQFNRRRSSRGNPPTPFEPAPFPAGYEYEVENALPEPHHRLSRRAATIKAGFLDARWLPITAPDAQRRCACRSNTTFGTRVVPRAGVVYALRYGKGFWGDTRARFSYGQGFKEPALEQSFGSDPCFPAIPRFAPSAARPTMRNRPIPRRRPPASLRHLL